MPETEPFTSATTKSRQQGLIGSLARRSSVGDAIVNFESFSRHMLTGKPEPHVTIHKRGTMSLNRPAYEALGSPTSVELLFDRAAQIVGLRAVAHDVPNACHVRASTPSPNGPWVVSAIAFAKYYDIDTSRSVRWPASVEDGILCVDLTQPGVPVTSNRARHDGS